MFSYLFKLISIISVTLSMVSVYIGEDKSFELLILGMLFLIAGKQLDNKDTI